MNAKEARQLALDNQSKYNARVKIILDEIYRQIKQACEKYKFSIEIRIDKDVLPSVRAELMSQGYQVFNSQYQGWSTVSDKYTIQW